jgi:pimeloyl-ACP methyl ester carboxylesterase
MGSSQKLNDKTIRVGEIDARVTDAGSGGFPLLMLHGSGMSRHAFDRQLNSALANRHRLVAIDLPGHGETANAADPATGYTITGLAQFVADAMKAMEIDRAAIFGWSLGGHVAIEMMAAYPECVAGTMITGAPPVGRGPIAMLRGFQARWDMLLASKQTFTEKDAERYARLCFGNEPPAGIVETILRSDGRMRATVMRSMMRGDGADQRRTVETASVPVAIVNGSGDPITRASYLASLETASLWEGKTHTVSGAGHAPFWETPNVFNGLLHRFMEHIALREAQPEAKSRPAEKPSLRSVS